MTEKEKITEEKIIESAQDIFVEKGMDGARMQEIADRAGINKALLHYYFRSKEKLFDIIFERIAKKISQAMFGAMMVENLSIEQRVNTFVTNYIDILLRNPFLPNFVINEITKNPKGLLARFESHNIRPREFFVPLQNQLHSEGYNVESYDLIVNLLSLCIFPVVAKPIIQQMIFTGDQKAYVAYIEKRKTEVSRFIMAGLEAYRI